ncbi:MAG: hypothetical protein H7Z38_14805 [Rubrivivax sp.]|nr:hypothetical protein [Pyrinomonadaceae bacterium]
MTTEAKDEARPAAGEDPLIGRAYLCCKGPQKKHTIRVVELITAGEDAGRYQLESEDDGHRWTIDPEKLARIFGESSERACGCFPLAADSEVTARPMTEAAGNHTQPPPQPAAQREEGADETPAAEADSAGPPDEDRLDAADAPGEDDGVAREPQEERRAEETPASLTPSAGVIFNEGSQQGALF